MNLRILQWNIGSAKTREPDANVHTSASYNKISLKHITDLILKHQPDIVTFQEALRSNGHDQIAELADITGLTNHVSHAYTETEPNSGAWLCQGVISKLPVDNSRFQYYLRPDITANLEFFGGVEANMYRMGISQVWLGKILVSTIHVSAFEAFGIKRNDPRAKATYDDITSRLAEPSEEGSIILGDFNIDTVNAAEYFPGLKISGYSELAPNAATDPRGRHLDRGFARGYKLSDVSVDSSALTDHYPVIFELEKF